MKVLIPVDGSPNADACLSRLSARQWQPGDAVHLLAVVDFLRLSEEQAHEVLTRAQSQFLNENVELTAAVVHGKAAGEILKAAQEKHVDEICMGAHGKHGMRDAIVGSVAHEVAERATCTVVLHKAKADGPVGAIKHMLVCVDDDRNLNDLVVRSVERSVHDDELRITVLHVLSPVKGVGSENPHTDAHLERGRTMEKRANLEKAFQEIVAELASSCKNTIIKLQIEIEADIVEAILNVAEQSATDLIVVGTHGRVGMEKFWLGSVSEGVFKRSPCSTEIVRALG